MYRKQISFVCVLVMLLAAWLLWPGQAQAENSRRSSSPSLVDRLDSLGQKVGGIFARKPKSDRSTGQADELEEQQQPRAGSAMSRSAQARNSRSSSQGTTQRRELLPHGLEGILPGTGQSRATSQPAASGQNRPTAPPPATSFDDYPSLSEVTKHSSQPSRRIQVQRQRVSTPPTNPMTSGATPTVAQVPPAHQAAAASAGAGASKSDILTQPLHERLERFRKSVFGNSTPAAKPATPSPTQPAVTPTKAAAAQRPMLAPEQPAKQTTPTVAPPESVPGQPTRAAAPSLTHQRPTPAQPERVAQAPIRPQSPKPQDDGRVLLTRQSPILNVRTLGPARIAVGKHSSYEVHIENLGEVAADDVVVTIALPEWADVVGREASSGAILSERSPSGGERLLWKIGPMEAKARQKATLGIVPRQSRPIDLAVRWDFTPIASQTVIEVEEPKLSLQLNGPREVRFGEPQVFKLEIANSGNGAAEDVVLTMMPLSPGEGAPTQHRLGTLAAGEQKVIDMELTARQSGTLAVKMELRCDGPARASLSESLLVRKPNIELVIDAPKMQFTGTVATYRIRVRNSGNATAEKVRLTAKIPPEAKLIAANGKGKPAADGRWVQWTLAQLAEGAEQELTLQCQLGREGYAQLKAEVLGKKIAGEAVAVTRVESIADLALTVDDPSGPVPLGQQANYTVTVHNRGTKDATGVEAIIYFSQGIEPVSAQGAGYKLRPGQVVFDSIGVVPAGKKVVLKVVAKAQAPGNHMFRAEVYCRPLGTKLVSEETTHFYQGDLDLQGPPRTMLGRGTPPNTGNPARTADRRNQPVGPPAAPSDVPSEPVEPGAARY